jgi:hypothetical protein
MLSSQHKCNIWAWSWQLSGKQVELYYLVVEHKTVQAGATQEN